MLSRYCQYLCSAAIYDRFAAFHHCIGLLEKIKDSHMLYHYKKKPHKLQFHGPCIIVVISINRINSETKSPKS